MQGEWNRMVCDYVKFVLNYEIEFHAVEFCINLNKVAIEYICCLWDLTFDFIYVLFRYKESLSNWFISYSTTICKLVDPITALGLSDYWNPNNISSTRAHCSSSNCRVRNLYTSSDEQIIYIWKSQLSILSCLSHRINSVLLARIAAARKMDDRRDRRVIAIVTSSMTFLSFYISRRWCQTLYVSIFHDY